MPRKITKKRKTAKRGRPKKVVPIPPTPLKAELPPMELKPTLPIIEGVQAVGIIEEKETAIHYKLANGTTTWVPKK